VAEAARLLTANWGLCDGYQDMSKVHEQQLSKANEHNRNSKELGNFFAISKVRMQSVVRTS
jgi:hypothetical protein